MIHLSVTLDKQKDGNRACVASVSDRVSARKLRRAKKNENGGGKEKRQNAHDSVLKTPLYTFHVSVKN